MRQGQELIAWHGWTQPFNVLRYEPGQHYDSHYDIFEPESYGPQPSQRVRHARAFLPLPMKACMQRVHLLDTEPWHVSAWLWQGCYSQTGLHFT